MTDNELTLLTNVIDHAADESREAISNLTAEVRNFIASCESCRPRVVIMDSQRLDERTTRLEHNWIRLTGLVVGASTLGSVTANAALKWLTGI